MFLMSQAGQYMMELNLKARLLNWWKKRSVFLNDEAVETIVRVSLFTSYFHISILSMTEMGGLIDLLVVRCWHHRLVRFRV